MKLNAILAIVLIWSVSYSEPLKILGVFPIFTRSHWNVGNGIMMSLVEAGHEVTMISPFPLSKPVKNYRDIKTEGIKELMEGFQKDFNPFKTVNNPWMVLPILSLKFNSIADLTLKSPEVQKLLKSNETFDAIIVEMFNTECLLGIANYFDAPLIAVSAFGSNKWINELTGTVAPSSIVPNTFLSFKPDMTFYERFYNTLFNIYSDAYMHYIMMPHQKKIYDIHFPNPRRSFEETLQNVSLVFLNTHISLGSPVPYTPNMIEIGGVNIDPRNKALPKDLESIITSAEHGVIYFSLGSHIPSSRLPKQTITVFVEAFRKLKQTVLWKLDNPAVIGDNAPKNLYTQTWFPQNEVLAHPNVKFFISHGGLLSTTETVYHGKPIIGIPVLGDQHLNIAAAARAGYGIKVDYKTITLEQFENALNEMLTNPKYVENIKRISSVYRDQPMTPRQTVAYWTEYVVRHKGALHLHSKSVEMSYIAKNGVDVAVTLIVLFAAISIAIIYCCLSCCRLFSKPKNIQNKKDD